LHPLEFLSFCVADQAQLQLPTQRPLLFLESADGCLSRQITPQPELRFIKSLVLWRFGQHGGELPRPLQNLSFTDFHRFH